MAALVGSSAATVGRTGRPAQPMLRRPAEMLGLVPPAPTATGRTITPPTAPTGQMAAPRGIAPLAGGLPATVNPNPPGVAPPPGGATGRVLPPGATLSPDGNDTGYFDSGGTFQNWPAEPQEPSFDWWNDDPPSYEAPLRPGPDGPTTPYDEGGGVFPSGPPGSVPGSTMPGGSRPTYPGGGGAITPASPGSGGGYGPSDPWAPLQPSDPGYIPGEIDAQNGGSRPPNLGANPLPGGGQTNPPASGGGGVQPVNGGGYYPPVTT
jgi:hypothetical protein